MSDPVTIGEIVASVLNLAASEGLKKFVGETATDAYKALKAKIASWLKSGSGDLAELPPSPAAQSMLAGIIDRQPAEDQNAALELARKVMDALKRDVAGSTGIEIEILEAMEARFRKISVGDGTGARIGLAKVAGTFRVDSIDVGRRPEKQ
jgi:hypothetical protein